MLTLRRKLAYQISALVVSLALICAAALWGLHGLHEDLGVALRGYQQLRGLYQLGSDVQLAKTLLNADHPEPAKARQQLRLALDKFDENFSSDDGDDWPAEQAIRQELERAAGEDSAGPVNTIAASHVIGEISNLDSRINRRIADAKQQGENKRRLTIAWTAGLSAGVVALAVILGLAQYRGVMNPLTRLSDGVRRVTAGRFTQRVPVSGTAEFANLAEDFNRMAAELDALYRDLQQKVDAKTKESLRNERLASVGYLAAGVAHEINNPLGVITGYAEFALQQLKQDQPPGTDEQIKSLQVICDEAFRCKQIVEKLLSLATSPKEEEPKKLELPKLAGEMVSMVAGMPQYRDRALSAAPAAEGCQIVGVEGQIRQILLNLLFNALEATATAGGVVKVNVAAEDGWVKMSVSDNGRGMTPQTLERIFEPFYTDPRGKAEPEADGGPRRGVGLGLSIVHAIVQRHGGSIEARSDGPGKGSQFVVTLPRAN